jgi:hypothetical protein
VVVDRELADVQALLRRADHHLARELHAGRAQVQPREDVAPERAHAAVRVAHAGLEEEVERAREHRVADVAVMPRHGARLDPVHAVAHHEVGARLELGQEARDLVEVVRQVRVAHDDVAAAGGREAGQVRASVAAARLVHDARSGRRRELGAAVLGCVVGDDHLAGNAFPAQDVAGGPHDRLDVLLLVEAGDHDRDEEVRLRMRNADRHGRRCVHRAHVRKGLPG